MVPVYFQFLLGFFMPKRQKARSQKQLYLSIPFRILPSGMEKTVESVKTSFQFLLGFFLVIVNAHIPAKDLFQFLLGFFHTGLIHGNASISQYFQFLLGFFFTEMERENKRLVWPFQFLLGFFGGSVSPNMLDS